MENETQKNLEDKKPGQSYKKGNSLVYGLVFHVAIVFIGLFSLININGLEDILGEYTLFYLIGGAFLYFFSIGLILVLGATTK